MKSTLRVDEIPACAGMKCSRVAPARNTRARLGYVAGLEEPRKLGFAGQNNRVIFNDARTQPAIEVRLHTPAEVGGVKV
mgnify:CR=1